MFWRLLLTYLLLVVAAVGLVGLLVWQKDRALFAELADTVGLAVVLILAVSAVVAVPCSFFGGQPVRTSDSAAVTAMKRHFCMSPSPKKRANSTARRSA